jgi:hypothetical protein
MIFSQFAPAQCRYEVRVFVKDPSDALRLGMPATVYLPLG